MDEGKEAPRTPPIAPPAEASDGEGDNDQEPMVFKFGAPQSNEEVQDQALHEAATANTRSPVTFNFGPQLVEAPENEFIASFKRHQIPSGIKKLAALINNRKRAATKRELRGGATGYIDEDESGTYDPKEARRTPPSPPRPAKRVKINHALDKDENPQSKKPTKQIGFQYSLMVKLDLKSEKGLDYLRSLPAGTSGHPPGFIEEDIDSDGSGYVVPSRRKRVVKRPRRLGVTMSRSDGLTIDVLTDGHPQRRGCRCCFEQGDDDCSLLKHPDEYPCEACEDAGVNCVLIVPPKFKKVCLRCKEKRRDCSYSLDGGKGVEACDACEGEGVTCCAEALTQSSMIRRFASRPARTKSKPASTTVSKQTVQERMYVACSQCRDKRINCTNRGKADPGPCRECRKANQACKFVVQTTRLPQFQAPPPTSSKTKKSFAFSSRHNLRSESSTPIHDRIGTPHSPDTLTETIYSELEKKNTRKAEKLIAKGKLSPSHPLHQSIFGPLDHGGGRRRKFKFYQTSPKLTGHTLGIAHIHITTSFCHPITFNYVPDPLLRNPCSWCHNPFFGLWGLASESGPRRVEGFYHADGQGFEEVYGGYSEVGFSKSVMCIACTYARVRITQCPAHRLRTLDPNAGEIDMRVFNDGKWSEAVDAYRAEDEKGAELVRNAKWCSICPAAAVLKCCSPQLFDENGEPVPQYGGKGGSGAGCEGCEGCGLLLCEDCAELMGKLIKGGARTGTKQLDTIFKEVKRNKLRYREGVRADAEFLTSGGELLRRIAQGMGASEGMVDDEGEVRVAKVEGEGGWIGGGFDGRGREKKREKNGEGWMNEGVKQGGKGKGKEKADIAEKAWMQYQAREKEAGRSSNGADSKGKGRMVANGADSGGRLNETASGGGRGSKGQIRPGTSMSVSSYSSSGARNGNRPTERSIGNESASRSVSGNNQMGNKSRFPQDSRGNSRSMAPPRGTGSNSGQRDQSTRHNSRGAGGNADGVVEGQRSAKRETNARVEFGGMLKERKGRKVDDEKPFGGWMPGIIDLTED
ncbi:hypothetical protein BKA65DRAFT_580709 [Rhexocercosporidium sp. MPI-PUGE-AT-0058]|nr:hypothetical protein BKA65DRAFT_580709 [Rhexocercosporidium sp. MPI-PUGE-AT-0058]